VSVAGWKWTAACFSSVSPRNPSFRSGLGSLVQRYKANKVMYSNDAKELVKMPSKTGDATWLLERTDDS